MIGLAVSNDLLIGIVCVLAIIALLLWITGWHR